MNVYEYDFIVECPVNGAKVSHHLTIESFSLIKVESVIEFCQVDPTFHEELADRLYAKFGGKQTMRAYHHGVWITTTRGDR